MAGEARGQVEHFSVLSSHMVGGRCVSALRRVVMAGLVRRLWDGEEMGRVRERATRWGIRTFAYGPECGA